MNDSKAPVILFGGSFDPPHTGHVELALLAADEVGASSVVFIPAGINPQKSEHPPTEGRHRVAMLESAIAHDPRASVSTIELDRPGPSYMIDTVEALAAELGEGHPPLRLLIGADQALNFRTWRRWEDLEPLAEPLILAREPHGLDVLPQRLAEVYPEDADRWRGRILQIPCLKASSTDVRDALGRGESLETLVPKSVSNYIRVQGLYGSGPARGRIET
jgi:nicotinate-nucleotide adenylyltransferase